MEGSENTEGFYSFMLIFTSCLQTQTVILEVVHHYVKGFVGAMETRMKWP